MSASRQAQHEGRRLLDGKIDKEATIEFFAGQVRKHDDEKLLDEMDALERHPLLYCAWPTLPCASALFPYRSSGGFPFIARFPQSSFS